jgi:hypothetical protein
MYYAKQVDFFATYTADVLTSSVKTILDIAWTIGFFVSGDFLLHRKAWLGRDLHDSTWEQVCSTNTHSKYYSICNTIQAVECAVCSAQYTFGAAAPTSSYM